MDMIACGTHFKIVTYTSGGSITTVDYLMTRQWDRNVSGMPSNPRRRGSVTTPSDTGRYENEGWSERSM